MKSMVFIFAIALLGLASNASAVDLSNRLGIGYSKQMGAVNDLPMITAHYYPNSRFAISGFGIALLLKIMRRQIQRRTVYVCCAV